MSERKGIIGFLQNLVTRNKPSDLSRIQLVDSGKSWTSNVDISHNDIIVGTIDRVANTISKAVAVHINNRGIQKTSSYYKLLNVRPNEMMPPTMFHYMVTFQLFRNSNALIFIEFDERTKKPKQLLPIDWSSAEFLRDSRGRLYVKTYINSTQYILLYDEIIHLRRNFRSGIFGTDPSQDVQQVTNLLDVNNQALIAAVANNGNLKAIIEMKLQLKDDKLKAYKDKFVSDYVNDLNTSGIGIVDSVAGFKELKNDYKFVEGEQGKELRERIYAYFGINEGIAKADFTEDQYTAFIEMTAEPIIKQMNEEYTYKLFTDDEINKGNKIVFKTDKMQVASLANKGKYIESIFTNAGVATLNEARAILDLSPSESEFADTNRVSLNNVDVNIVNEYQMERARQVGRTPVQKSDNISVDDQPSNAFDFSVDLELTNYPCSGDDKTITLKNSNHKQFDFFFAKKINEKHPDLFEKITDASLINNFKMLEQIRDRESDDRELTTLQKAWLKIREKQIEQYMKSEKLDDIIKIIQYGGVVEKGQDFMKSLINKEIEKE